MSTAAVVSAAVELADEHGPGRLTLAAVARRTGVATPSLYKHVRSVEALQQKVAARVTAELAKALSSAVAGRSGQDAVRSLAHAYRDYALSHPGRYPLTQRVPDSQDPQHLAAAELAVQTVVAALRGYGLVGDAATDATRVARSALRSNRCHQSGTERTSRLRQSRDRRRFRAAAGRWTLLRATGLGAARQPARLG